MVETSMGAKNGPVSNSYSERHKERDRETKRQRERDRQTDRQREKERKRAISSVIHIKYLGNYSTTIISIFMFCFWQRVHTVNIHSSVEDTRVLPDLL